MSNAVLRENIKSLFHALGWSERQAADYIYDEMSYDPDDIDNKKRFYESFRKKLNRGSTKLDELITFEEILKKHREFRRLDQISPVYVPNEALTPETKQMMIDLSRSATDIVKKIS